ncbi:MAG: hypothetical protein HXY22_06640 [Alphaproteobacteria bacterium]|nr:hypothetical protein [Alphaproteobacteria bacterium]
MTKPKPRRRQKKAQGKPAKWTPVAATPGAYLAENSPRSNGKGEAQQTLSDLNARLATAKARSKG